MKWRSLNCKLACVFRKQACLSTVERGERARAHMVARLTKISITLSRYFHIAQVGSSVLGITSLYIRQPSSVARLKIVVKLFKRCYCIKIKCGPLLLTCHNIDTGPAVSILVSSNLCDNTSSYRCIKHSTKNNSTLMEINCHLHRNCSMINNTKNLFSKITQNDSSSEDFQQNVSE